MPILNHTYLNKLIVMAGAKKQLLLQSLLRLVNNAESEIAQLSLAIQQKNYADAKAILHRLRGSFATVGAIQLPELALTLEQNCEEHTLGITDFSVFFAAYRQTAAEFSSVIAQHSEENAVASAALDMAQLTTLLQYLQSQNLLALDLTAQLEIQLCQLIGTEQTQQLCQLVTALHFQEAATLLRQCVKFNG